MILVLSLTRSHELPFLGHIMTYIYKHTYANISQNVLKEYCWYEKCTYDKKRLCIPNGKVDNNMGPDRSTDPKALDRKHCRQPYF